jgi:hypothetical protein
VDDLFEGQQFTLGVNPLNSEYERVSVSLLAAVPAIIENGETVARGVFDSGLGDHDLFPFMAAADGDSPTYEKARQGSEWDKWDEAMQKEIEGLFKAGTIDELPVPEDPCPPGSIGLAGRER